MKSIPIVASHATAALVQHHHAGDLQLHSLPPLSLYVHLPWCIKKCPYCDFNSHELRGESQESRYIAALMHDLEAALPLIWGRSVQTVFIGGGTPSLFSPDGIDALLGGIRARVKLAAGAEITLEANPGTFERERFAAFAQAGITRLSIGVQSFNDDHLKALGRVHDRAQALAAVDEAARSFATFNLDLMYALPGQSLAHLQDDLRTALAFSPPHLSVYQLTMEPNTVFGSRPPPHLPDEDSAYDMLDALVEATAAQGLQRYEVSAFSKLGHRCVHNLNYWGFGDYLGIGAGAHSKLSFASKIVRQVRLRDPQRYIEAAAQGQSVVTQDNTVPARDLPFEFMMNALRLNEGFALADFAERTGLPTQQLLGPINHAESKGLLCVASDGAGRSIVKPTPRGFDLLNDLMALFLPDAEVASK